MKNVVTEIVKNGLCSGCGVCVGITEKCLKMVFDKYGQLVPIVLNCKDCGNCLSVCPFAQSTTKSSLVSPLGNYIKNYVGYSNIEEERIKGASGGLATRVLRVLLERKMVDGVIVVGSSKKKDRFFEPVIVKKSKELANYAGSKYYPVEFSSVLKLLKKEVGQYAIVGLPCVVDALRLVQQKNSLIGGKIKYLLGLICGHNKNKNYTSFLIRLTGTREKDVKDVQFRCKENTNKASNYGFKGILKNGENTRQLNFSDSLVGKIWCNYFFSTNACFYCEDLFAKYADISFMDAWLKPYINDPKGTSIIAIRNEKLKAIIEKEMRAEHISLSSIEEEKVINSQKGALIFKKNSIDKKRIFLFNSWVSSKIYSGDFWVKIIGMSMLKLYILFMSLVMRKYKLTKIFIFNLIRKWRIE